MHNKLWIGEIGAVNEYEACQKRKEQVFVLVKEHLDYHRQKANESRVSEREQYRKDKCDYQT